MEVFIVNRGEGSQVITAGKLADHLKRHAKEAGSPIKWRKCDLESIARDGVRANMGKALTETEFESRLNDYARALNVFTELTPMGLLKLLDGEHPAVNNA